MENVAVGAGASGLRNRGHGRPDHSVGEEADRNGLFELS